MKKFFKKKWVKRVLSLVVAAMLVVTGVVVYKHFSKSDEVESTQTTAVVSRRNIVNTVTGSGTVEAYETYDIVPTVTGKIVYCEAEVGDWVEEGEILYMFDTETSDNAISKAENSVENASINLERAQENVDNLTIVAPAQGVVSNLSLGIGDKANGNVCTITNNTYMIAEIPVSAADVNKINVGDGVSVGIEKYMMTLEGTVNSVRTGSVAVDYGARVTTVEVKITNPGAITEGTYCSATFHTSEGEVEGAEAATLNYPKSAKATAEQSGTVKSIKVKNGDWVNSGDVIAILENSSVTDQLKSAQMSYSDAVTTLSDREKEAEDYVLTAPISGKVMQKNLKKDDTVAGQSATTLMVIADTTKMKFTMNIDELDVAKISVGQEVSITADAIENVEFTGVIETISLLGTSSSGVTYYPVDVRIDNPGELMPNMNVSAEIIIENAENVISVPAGAVTFYGGKYYVTVVGEVEGMEDATDVPRMPEDLRGDMEMPFEMPTGDMTKMPQRGEGGMPQGEMPEGMPQGETPRQNIPREENGEGEEAANHVMYDEPIQVEVTTGVSDDDYIEITSGLSVGQIVKVTGSTDENSNGGMMPGGEMFPGGGMPGGMPQGNMGGGRMPGGMR